MAIVKTSISREIFEYCLDLPPQMKILGVSFDEASDEIILSMDYEDSELDSEEILLSYTEDSYGNFRLSSIDNQP
jgi:hypothetical protein